MIYKASKQAGHIHIFGIIFAILVIAGLYLVSRHISHEQYLAGEVQDLRERVVRLEAKVEVLQRTK
jgi:sensor domain CHASE-containing protein